MYYLLHNSIIKMRDTRSASSRATGGITVILFAVGRDLEDINLPEESSVADLFDKEDVRYGSSTRVKVNGILEWDGSQNNDDELNELILEDGDRITVTGKSEGAK